MASAMPEQGCGQKNKLITANNTNSIHCGQGATFFVVYDYTYASLPNLLLLKNDAL